MLAVVQRIHSVLTHLAYCIPLCTLWHCSGRSRIFKGGFCCPRTFWLCSRPATHVPKTIKSGVSWNPRNPRTPPRWIRHCILLCYKKFVKVTRHFVLPNAWLHETNVCFVPYRPGAIVVWIIAIVVVVVNVYFIISTVVCIFNLAYQAHDCITLSSSLYYIVFRTVHTTVIVTTCWP